MRILPKKSLRALIVTVVGLLLAGAGYLAFHFELKRVRERSYQDLRGWQQISGHWSEHGDVFSNSNYGRGDMLIALHSQAVDYRISADVRFDLIFAETLYGDAGLVIRATDPEQGVDSYRGYYAGIRPNEQTVVLGRASYDWSPLEVVKLATPITPGIWNHLELAAQGCKLIVTVTPDGGRPVTRVEHQDKECLTEGVAGLRSFYTQASWRNVKIGPL